MKLLFKGGRIVSPLQGLDAVKDLLVIDGVIAEINDNIKASDAQIYPAEGLVITPGLIDMHVHLREPGLEAKEDIYSGSRAAAAGGFTTIACMPNTKPVVDSAIIVAGLIEKARTDGAVKVRILGAMTKGQAGKELAEIGDMIFAGAAAISEDGNYVNSAKIMRTGLEYTSAFGKPVITHDEDEELVSEGVMHEGKVSAMLGMKGRPAVGEDIAVARDILLAEYTGAQLHVAHVSTKGAVELIRQAKKRGVKVTTEATPHHLSLTDEAVMGFDPATKVNPPLRSEDHVAALLEGLKDGTIDAIASDHAPHAYEEKDVEFKYAPSGFSGLETSLGVILTNLYHTGKFSLPEIITKMSVAPARILGLEAGSLAVGMPADITVINPELEWVVESSKFYTRGKATPFAGVKLRGKAVAAIVDGKIVMENGEVLL